MKRIFLQAAAMTMVANCAMAQPCLQEGLYAGMDFLFLSPKISDQGIANIFFYGNGAPAAAFGGSTASELEFAQRVFLGYQGDLGGGAQIRWFTFDNDLEYVGEWENGGPPVELIGTTNLDVDAIDMELTQSGAFRSWTWMGTAGARYGRVDFSEEAINFEDIPSVVFIGDTGVEFEGAGPTLSVQGCRPILIEGFSLFGAARTALLFGDTDLRVPFRDEPFTIHNEFVQVWEFQAGCRYQTLFMDTVNMFGGIFWEAQRWDSDSGLLGDLAFHGFGCQWGVTY